MEFAIGGLAAVGAGFFTNPLEVVKVRMQLQGELLARGRHAVHYRNVFHAAYVIVKHDGPLAIQAGLVPALWFQLTLNGFRLGLYQTICNAGLVHNAKGEQEFFRTALAAGVAGCGGAILGSPLYLIKTHLQARAAKEIAFGHQHSHDGMLKGFATIFREAGVRGLFRGVTAAVPRALFGSMAQLTAFGYSREYLLKHQSLRDSPLLTTFAASMIGGVVVAVVMTPLDLISTRLYNQGVDAKGRGLLYGGYLDCVVKIYRSESLLGFYKGLGACYFRLGPHTVLTLVFWDRLKDYHSLYLQRETLT